MITNSMTDLLSTLLSQDESELLEFKHNFHSDDEIGELISALANSAALLKAPSAYLVFGIEDRTRRILGTTFKPSKHKKGNEDFEIWLNKKFEPTIHFSIHELNFEGKDVVVFVIPPAKYRPLLFIKTAFIRIGSITKRLSEFPDKESILWQESSFSIEKEIAKDHIETVDLVRYLSIETYFDQIRIPHPSSPQAILDRFIESGLVTRTNALAITNLGAILFAKNLREFEQLSNKTIRVIVYKGKNKAETIREYELIKGYAIGFSELIEWINSQLPSHEEIGSTLRSVVRVFPELAIRELVANAIIHQNFSVSGHPMVEIYSDRIEISNPGQPLVGADRFFDSYISRNERLSDLMRRIGFCEEKGSGLDKVISLTELERLPPIKINITEYRTTVTLFRYKSMRELDNREKIEACYQHACLKYISNDKMTNQSLRQRFDIEEKNAAIASRIIADTLKAELIKVEEPENQSRKFKRYLPFWA